MNDNSLPHTVQDSIPSSTDHFSASPSTDCSSSTIPPILAPMPDPPLRKSQRSTAPPAWMKDFICPQPLVKQQTTSTPTASSHSHNFNTTSYPMFSFSHLAHLSAPYVASLTNVLQSPEPTSYAHAIQFPEWVKAMDLELTALEQNHTWTVTTLPPDKKALTSKWVYKTKFRPDGGIERHKARLVIRGFEQVKDKDYKHTFSPVAKLTTVILFIALAAAKDWSLHQLDINNAFLHGYIDEEVYMQPPQGYSKALPGQVCKLQRSLYGLKQASRQCEH